MLLYDHCRTLFVFCGALLSETIFYVSEENGIEESVISINKTLKRKIIDTFPEETSFYPNGKYLIVPSSNIKPCQFIAVVLKGKGLNVSSTRKVFLCIN